MIAAAWSNNLCHRKRGFHIQDQPTSMVGVHLVEESVELLAELMEDQTGEADMAAVTEEAADVLICLTRILFDCDILIKDVIAKANEKMTLIWVDEKDIDTDTPGMTRRARNDA